MTAINCSFHTSEQQPEPSKMLHDTGTYFPPSKDTEQICGEHETRTCAPERQRGSLSRCLPSTLWQHFTSEVGKGDANLQTEQS